MKDNQKEEIVPSQPIRKLRHPRIINRQSSPLQTKHKSLRKLMEMRVLPPLHPQTEAKRTLQPVKQCCPEEFQEASKDVSLLMLGKSQQLLGETPKFSFQNIVIKHLQRQCDQMMTISHNEERSKRKQSELGITFGKLTKKLESHRYTEIQQRPAKDKRRKPLIQMSNLAKLGKYDSVFKPMYKESPKDENEVVKDHILPPINSKYL